MKKKLTVWQVVVLVEVDELEVVDTMVVVVSSRHPHHPGVLHVSVRVRDRVVLVAVELVIGWVWVPFSNFHR